MRHVYAALLVALIPSTVLSAPFVKIDFAKIDLGANGQRVEPGFVGISGAAVNTSAVLPPTNVTSSPATGSVNFTIAIDNGSNGAVDWRDRGDSTSTDALVRIGEDHIKHNNGLLEVTLAGVPVGTYEVKSYHVDADFNNLSDDIKVLITDAVGTSIDAGVSADASQGGSGVNGLTEGLLESSSMVFQFVSDGSPVTLLFDGRDSAIDQTPLNGLEISLLQAVPEPSSIAAWFLTGAAVLGLGFFRRRGRRE